MQKKKNHYEKKKILFDMGEGMWLWAEWKLYERKTLKFLTEFPKTKVNSELLLKWWFSKLSLW